MTNKKDEGNRPEVQRWFFVAFLGCCVLYLSLLNGYWVRSGDGEVYLGIARNLITHKGYTFNGQPVAILPPLWPIVLAGAMKISASWWFLKLLPMGCMIGFLSISYFIMLRFTTPKRSAIVVLLTALLAQVFPLAIWFFSDALFALLAVAALLLSMRVNEGRSSWMAAPMIVLLAAASVAVRWNGVLWWLMIAAALWRGRSLSPRWTPGGWRLFSIAFVSGLASAIVFLYLRRIMRVPADRIDPRYDPFLAGAYALVNTPENFHELLDRAMLTGGWIGGLLWDIVYDWRIVRPLGLLGGWVVLAACAVTGFEAIRHRTWIWIAAAMQLLVLAFDWPHPMPRYLLPLAPLVILAAWMGFDRIAELSKQRWISTVIVRLFIASIVLLNFIPYAMEVWVQHTRNFYHHYEAGVNESFIAASQFAADRAPATQEVGITYRINVNGRYRTTAGPMRTFNFLTGRPVVLAPWELCDADPAHNHKLAEWVQEHNVHYFLWQPPIEAVYHFRGTKLNLKRHDEGDVDWRIYELRDGKLMQIALPALNDQVRTVPGLR
jgi:hypothetical protein